MAVSGTSGYNSDISTNIRPVGTRRFQGDDSYTAVTEVISGGMSGDVYQCNVTGAESNTSSVTVEDAVAPNITLLEQTAPTTVRVDWTASLTSPLTGYAVRYSLSGGRENVTAILSSTTTSADITDLSKGRTYTFLVEAVAGNKLPGVSGEMTITLGEGGN
jgi:hypothetical protein